MCEEGRGAYPRRSASRPPGLSESKGEHIDADHQKKAAFSCSWATISPGETDTRGSFIVPVYLIPILTERLNSRRNWNLARPPPDPRGYGAPKAGTIRHS